MPPPHCFSTPSHKEVVMGLFPFCRLRHWSSEFVSCRKNTFSDRDHTRTLGSKRSPFPSVWCGSVPGVKCNYTFSKRVCWSTERTTCLPGFPPYSPLCFGRPTLYACWKVPWCHFRQESSPWVDPHISVQHSAERAQMSLITVLFP